jgi:long-chain acyl-CoA synthetase
VGASGGDISAKVNGGFRWHEAAAVFDGAGRRFHPVTAGPSVIAERPAGAALALAVATGVFRVGGEGPGPLAGFETLTSGSSGAPRRIAREARSWVASFMVNAGLFGIGPGARVAVLGRLTQSLALYGGVEGVHLGAEVHLLDELRPDRQRGVLAERGVHLIYATPAQMRLLAEGAGPELGALRHVLIGGSKLDEGLRAAIERLAPKARVHEFYGAAETSFITIAGPGCPVGSVGAPYPGVEIRVEGALGEIGEIWVRSPYLFQGYAGNDPGGARRRDGWVSVGEMGAMREGWLYLAGRAGRMVTVADQNVFPEEIEQFMAGLPGVDRVAVVPRQDRLRGQHLVAVVMGDRAEEAALLGAVRVRLGPLKAPKAVVWRQDWPLLPSGKTDLRRIAAEVAG